MWAFFYMQLEMFKISLQPFLFTIFTIFWTVKKKFTHTLKWVSFLFGCSLTIHTEHEHLHFHINYIYIHISAKACDLTLKFLFSNRYRSSNASNYMSFLTLPAFFFQAVLVSFFFCKEWHFFF